MEREALARLVTEIAAAAEAMEREKGMHPTVFEIETALAFLYFREKQCDVVVLETGMGGLLDATNVVTTTVMEVIASISMDHMGFLGNTLAEIAENKAGIIKPHTQVVTMRQRPEAAEVLERVSRERGCTLHVADDSKAQDIRYGYETQQFSYGGYERLEISLAGVYQIPNAVLAVEALKVLKGIGWRITEEALRAGLKKTAWRGRFTVVFHDPLVIIDGAHNRDAALTLKKSLELYFTNRHLLYIMGVFKDKEYEEIAKITAPLSHHIITVETPGNPRALPAEELLAVVKKYQPSSEPADSIEEAVRKSLQMAEKEDVIIAFGSLSFLGEVTRALEAVRSAQI